MPRCIRCRRSISAYSDEFREWLPIERGGDDLGIGAEIVGAACRDCLTPDERDGYADDLRRMQAADRRRRE